MTTTKISGGRPAPAKAQPKADPAGRAVQTELTSQLPYWMRWIPMHWLRDLVLLIHEAPAKPSAMALGPLGAKNGILLRRDNAPLSEGAMYHYRMALRHLGIVEVKDGQYHLNYARPEVASLVRAGRRGLPLSPLERDALSALVTGNEDCRRIFLRLFMKSDSFTLAELRASGSPCHVYYPDGTGEVVVENPANRRRVRYQSPTAQNASIWGVRTWCLQLEMLDELYLSHQSAPEQQRHVIFPVDPARFDDATVRGAIQEAVPGNGSAQTLEIIELLGRVCSKERVSARVVKSYLVKASERATPQATFVPAPDSERPTGPPGKGGLDRLHHKGWLAFGGKWHRKVTLHSALWRAR